ncbi:substrate-binding domain-containing protein, partial [Phaeobacter sp. HF9A]|uniref:substrate-binding domain-containing protein n=1 Tax=Phaeobacter sp. HF9A TaxID=2721561 RepID=UPI00142F5B29
GFTRAGAALLAHARLALATINRATEEVKQLTGQGNARVNISVTPVMAAANLPRLVNEFYRIYPDGVLRLNSDMLSSVVRQLLEGTLDFAVAFAQPLELPPELGFHQINVLPIIPITRGESSIGTKLSWQELAQHRWAINPSEGGNDIYVLQWLARRGVTLAQPPLEWTSPYMISILNASIDLVTLCPAPLYERQLRPLGLKVIEVPELPPKMPLGVIYRKGMPLSDSAQMMLDMVTRIGATLT